MSMIGDRDLLVLEPAVFTAAGAAATRVRAATDAAVSGGTLTSASSDFAALGVDEGQVGVVDGVAVEVLGRSSATQLQVSLPRASPDDPSIAPASGTALPLEVLTFARLIARQEQALLAELGSDPQRPGHAIDASMIVNTVEVAALLAQRCVAMAFALAAAASPSDESLAAKADLHAALAARLAAGTAALLDLDGDGIADALRRFGVTTWTRT